MMTAVLELPIVDPQPRERADAARNRARILAAASELVAERGIEQVSMEDVARAACVGTGTLYRRFGDRAGLALALLDEHTRELQNAMIAGPPPLGPGAPADERLRAFGDAFLDYLDRHAEILVVAERIAPAADAPHAFLATHLTILLEEAAPHLDARYTAEALLAMLAPAHDLRLRRSIGWSSDRLSAGWRGIVDAICAPPAGSR